MRKAPPVRKYPQRPGGGRGKKQAMGRSVPGKGQDKGPRRGVGAGGEGSRGEAEGRPRSPGKGDGATVEGLPEVFSFYCGETRQHGQIRNRGGSSGHCGRGSWPEMGVRGGRAEAGHQGGARVPPASATVAHAVRTAGFWVCVEIRTEGTRGVERRSTGHLKDTRKTSPTEGEGDGSSRLWRSTGRLSAVGGEAEGICSASEETPGSLETNVGGPGQQEGKQGQRMAKRA